MTRRGTVLRAAAVAVCALTLLAACSSSSSKKAGALSKLKLRVGVLFTTSGKGGDFAQAALGASKLATDDAVRDNVTIEVVQGDYAGDPKLVAKTVADLASKSDAIVVATDDPVVLPSLASVDLPIVHALIAREGITGRDNVFSVAPTTSQEAQTLADYLTKERKYKRISVLTDTTETGREGGRAIADALAADDATPRLQLEFTPGGDIHTPVAHAGQVSSDALVVWVDSPSEAARIVVEVHKMNFAFQIVLSGNLATATFAKNASAQVTPVAFRDGMLSVGPWAGPWFTLPRIVKFYERFQTDNSAQAPVQAASVYDAVSVIAHAARARSSVVPGDIVAGLEATKDFEGAGVPVTFGPDKHIGIDLDDLGIYGYTKDQNSAGGSFFPDVDTGGGFFTIVTESLNLPDRYRFLTTKV